MYENRAMMQTLQKLAKTPPAPLIDEAARQIQEFKDNHPITVDSNDEAHETTEDDAADALEAAVDKVLAAGFRTGDLMAEGCTQVGCQAMGEELLKAL